MPVPKAMGTQGSNRPAPASARTQFRRISTKGDQALRPEGANPGACAAPRGGQVPAIPCVRPLLLPGSAIPVTRLAIPFAGGEATGSCYRGDSGTEAEFLRTTTGV